MIKRFVAASAVIAVWLVALCGLGVMASWLLPVEPVDRILSQPALRRVSLWLCQPSSDLYYLSNASSEDFEEIWRMDANGKVAPTHIEEGLPKHSVAKSPGGKYLAYTIKGDDWPEPQQLRVACGDGRRPFTAVAAESHKHHLLGMTWLNADTLVYEDWNARVQLYWHDIATGEIQLHGNPWQFRAYQINPRDPDLITYQEEKVDTYWLWNRRAGQRTPLLSVPLGGRLLAEHDYTHNLWSPDGRYLAINMYFTDKYAQKGSDDRDGEILFFDSQTKSLEQVTHLRRPGMDLMTDSLRWSPDGRWLAFKVYRWDAAGQPYAAPNTLQVLSMEDRQLIDLGVELRHGSSYYYTWSPDSRQIAVASSGDADYGISIVTVATKVVHRVTDKRLFFQGALTW